MRKIFSLLMAAVLSISTAFATTVYCKMTQSWWTQDGAAVGVHYWGGAAATTWPGVRMSPVTGETGMWSYDVPADATGFMFVRVNGSGDIADWGAKTANLAFQTDGKNLYTITSEAAVWGDPGVAGEWSVYQAGGGEDSDAYAYVKVTSAPTSWAGEYLIVYEGDSVAFNSSLANNTTDYVGIGGKYSRFSVKIHNDTIDYHDTIAAKHFTIAAIEGKTTYSIKSASNLYLGRTSTSNGLDKSSTTVYENSISYNEGNFIDIVSSAGLYMRYNKSSNEQRFRFFKADTYTAQQAIQLYKKVKIETTGGEDPVTPPTPAKFYVTGNAALVGAEKAWAPNAIKSESDTLVLNLQAEQEYALKVTVDGTWNTAKSYDDLSVKPEGVSADNDGNIVFTLAEAGEVKVIYTAEVFKIEGNFYVAPAEDPAKFYVTGNAALVGAEKAWAPNAIKSESDTLVLNLQAEQEYALKVTVDGTWNTAKSYDDLSVKPEGVSADNDGNIVFTLAEAGEVKVIYTAEVFKIEGNFYVEPTPVAAKFYVTGDSALVTDAGFAGQAWNPAAIKAEADTLVLNLKAEQVYKLKVSLDGTWNTAKGFNDLTEKPEGVTMDNDENIIFSLAEAGIVNVIYIAGETPIFKIAGNFYVDPTPVVPTVAVKGSMNDWAAEIPFELSEDKTYASLTVEHISADEYEFKLIINGEWRSNGYRYHREFTGAAGITENNEANMVFVADVDGQYTFKWTFADNSLLITYPAAQPGTGVENTAADAKVVKSLKNGILVIEKNNKVYNVLGIEMK